MTSLYHKKSSELNFDFNEDTNDFQSKEVDRTYSINSSDEELDFQLDPNDEENISESGTINRTLTTLRSTSSSEVLNESLKFEIDEVKIIQDPTAENVSYIMDSNSDQDDLDYSDTVLHEEVSINNDTIEDERENHSIINQNQGTKTEKVAWLQESEDDNENVQTHKKDDDIPISENDWQRLHPNHQNETYFESLATATGDPLPDVDQSKDISSLESEENLSVSKGDERLNVKHAVKQQTQKETKLFAEKFNVILDGQRRNSAPNVQRSPYGKDPISTNLNWTTSIPSRIPYKTTKKLESRNKKIMKTMEEMDNRIAIRNGTSTARRFSQPVLLPDRCSSSDQQRSVDRLYRKALDLKQSRESRRESLRAEQELKECTFCPEINTRKSNLFDSSQSRIPVETRLLSAKEKYESNRRQSLQYREQMEALVCTFSPDIGISNSNINCKDTHSRGKNKPIHDRLYQMGTNKVSRIRTACATAPPECTFSPALEQTKKFNEKYTTFNNYLSPDQRREQLYQYGKLKINHERELEASKKPTRKPHNDDHIECTFFPLTNHARGRELQRLTKSQAF